MKKILQIRATRWLIAAILTFIGQAHASADAQIAAQIRKTHGRSVSGFRTYSEASDVVKKAIRDEITEQTKWARRNYTAEFGAERPVNIVATKGAEGTDGRIWVISGNSKANPLGGKWEQLPGGSTSKVAAGPQGEFWVIDKSSLLWFITAGQEKRTHRWWPIGTGYHDIAVGNDGTVYCLKGKVGGGFAPYIRRGTSLENPFGTHWEKVGFSHTSLNQISVDNLGNLWGIAYQGGKQDGTLWFIPKNNLKGQKQIDPKTTDFHHVAAGNGTVWCLKNHTRDGNYNIWVRGGVSANTPTGNRWAMIKGDTGKIALVPGDHAFLIDTSGLLWFVPSGQGNNAKAWKKFGTGWQNISANAYAPAPQQAAVPAPAQVSPEIKKIVAAYNSYAREYDWAIGKWPWDNNGRFYKVKGFFDKYRDQVQKNYPAIQAEVAKTARHRHIKNNMPNAAQWMKFWNTNKFLSPVELFEKQVQYDQQLIKQTQEEAAALAASQAAAQAEQEQKVAAIKQDMQAKIAKAAEDKKQAEQLKAAALAEQQQAEEQAAQAEADAQQVAQQVSTLEQNKLALEQQLKQAEVALKQAEDDEDEQKAQALIAQIAAQKKAIEVSLKETTQQFAAYQEQSKQEIAKLTQKLETQAQVFEQQVAAKQQELIQSQKEVATLQRTIEQRREEIQQLVQDKQRIEQQLAQSGSSGMPGKRR